MVVGAGAVGATTGGALALAGHRVALVDHWYEHVEAVRRSGLSLTVDGRKQIVEVAVHYPDEIHRIAEPVPIVLLACKAYDTGMLLGTVAPYLAPDGVVVSLQNGLNEDAIAELVGSDRTLGCVVHYSAMLQGPADALRFSPSEWHSYTVGELDRRLSPRVHRVSKLLSAAGPSTPSDDIFGALWGKLAINCMINGLTAATGLDTGALWLSSEARAVMIAIGSEVIHVARAQGRAITPIRLAATKAELSEAMLSAAAPGGDASRTVDRLMEAEGEHAPPSPAEPERRSAPCSRTCGSGAVRKSTT